jgi:hypothetical protein
MVIKNSILIALAALLVSNSSFSASQITGGTLYELCRSDDQYKLGTCDGYIFGVIDAMHAGHLSNHFTVCMPSGVTAAQLRLSVRKHMEDAPENLQFLADGKVAEALAKYFPCQQQEEN